MKVLIGLFLILYTSILLADTSYSLVDLTKSTWSTSIAGADQCSKIMYFKFPGFKIYGSADEDPSYAPLACQDMRITEIKITDGNKLTQTVYTPKLSSQSITYANGIITGKPGSLSVVFRTPHNPMPYYWIQNGGNSD